MARQLNANESDTDDALPIPRDADDAEPDLSDLDDDVEPSLADIEAALLAEGADGSPPAACAVPPPSPERKGGLPSAKAPVFVGPGEGLAFQHPDMHVIAGFTKSGKTTLLRALMYRALLERQFDRVIVLCGAPPSDGDYDWVPSKWFFDKPTEAHIDKIIEQQRGAMKKVRTCLILDDCMGALNMRKKGTAILFHLLGTYRKYNLSMFVVVQGLTSLLPDFRANASSIFATSVSLKDSDILRDKQGKLTKKEMAVVIDHQQKYQFLRVTAREPIMICDIPLIPPFRFIG